MSPVHAAVHGLQDNNNVMHERGRTTNYQPRKSVLESLGVSEDELQDAVFSSFVHGKRDCHSSLRDLAIRLKGRTYRLEDVASVQSWEDGHEVD
jgi:hypothetical protein